MKKIFIMLFIAWASCVQTSPERFAVWIVIIKLLSIAAAKIEWDD